MIKTGEALAKGWQLFKGRPLMLIGALLLTVGLNLLPNGVMGLVLLGQRQGLLSAAFVNNVPFGLAIASYGITSFTTLGYLSITLKLCRGEVATLKDLFAGGPVLLSFCAASLVFTLITAFPLVAAFIGYILLIPELIPSEFDVTRLLGLLLVLPLAGIISLYWGAQFGYFGFGILEHKLLPLESLRFSHQLTRGLRWPLVGFTVIQGLLLVAGVLTCGLGLLVTVPVTALAYAWIYGEIRRGRVSVLGG